MPRINFFECKTISTSVYGPNGNGGVEGVNHTMAQMLATVCKKRQDDREMHFPHVSFIFHNSVRAATGLDPNEVLMNRLPGLSLSIFEQC